MTDIRAGQTVTVTGEYFNQPGLAGVLTDPTGSITLTITYGTGGTVVAGPFTYAGASLPTSGQIYRQSQGVYQFDWSIPYSVATGIYVMNWVFVDGPHATQFDGFENVPITGGGVTPPASPDIGFWTGSLSGNGITIPLGGVDDQGVGWILEGVDGWDGAPTVGQLMQRGGDHGGYLSPQYYGPRPITLRVSINTVSQAVRDAARARMQQAADVNAPSTFVYNEAVPKTVQARRSGVLKESSDTLVDCSFTVLLIAPDPRKYGTQTKVITASANGQLLGIAAPLTAPITLPAQPPAGSATVENDGNFETLPTIAIAGPISQPAIYNQTSGQTVSFSTLVLAASDILTVDFANRVAYLNGSFRPADASSAWFRLLPGVTQLVLQGAAAAGSQMTITYQDAWM